MTAAPDQPAPRCPAASRVAAAAAVTGTWHHFPEGPESRLSFAVESIMNSGMCWLPWQGALCSSSVPHVLQLLVARAGITSRQDRILQQRHRRVGFISRRKRHPESSLNPRCTSTHALLSSQETWKAMDTGVVYRSKTSGQHRQSRMPTQHRHTCRRVLSHTLTHTPRTSCGIVPACQTGRGKPWRTWRNTLQGKHPTMTRTGLVAYAGSMLGY